MFRRLAVPATALGLTLVLGLVAAACGSGSDPDSDAAPSATLGRRSTTTAAPSTATTLAGQEDFTSILRDLLARRDEAYEKNDPTLLDAIYATQCECLAKGKQVIEQQRAEGTHAAGPRLIVRRTETVSRLSLDYAVVRGVVEQPPYSLVDRDGKVVRPGEAHGPLATIYELGRKTSGWMILGITTEGPVEQ